MATQLQLLLDKPNHRISPYIIEFVAALERILAHAATGSRKVLETLVLYRLWFSIGIKEGDFPSLCSTYVRFSRARLELNIAVDVDVVNAKWPMNRQGTGPAIATSSAQEYWFDYGHTQVSIHLCALPHDAHPNQVCVAHVKAHPSMSLIAPITPPERYLVSGGGIHVSLTYMLCNRVDIASQTIPDFRRRYSRFWHLYCTHLTNTAH